MNQPSSRSIRWEASHRLISSRYSEDSSAFANLADTPAELESLELLNSATDERVLGEQFGSVGIGRELVYAIPHAHIVNAAFLHPSPTGSRFNDNTRGAWYAADSQPASIAEVVYHKSRRLKEIVAPGETYGRPARDLSTFDDWLADFNAEFHVLEPPEHFAEYLQPEPVPQCYAAGQALARQLLQQRSNGILYPSVRYAGAHCIVCFRPALVYHPRRAERLHIEFVASETGYDYHLQTVSP